MKKLLALILCIQAVVLLHAQELQVFSDFNDTETTQINDLVIITSLNLETSDATESNGLVISPEVVPLLVVGELTGVKDLQRIEGISLFPNPVLTSATLERKGSLDSYRIELIGEAGTVLSHMKWNTGEESVEIPFGNFASGFYIIRVMNEERTMGSEFKVVKR